MKMAEFKALPIEDGLTMLNEYMLNIKDIPGRLEEKFKNGPFEFGYSLLNKYFRGIGISLDKETYQFVSSNETTVKVTNEVVKPKQDVVKREKPKEHTIVKHEQTLTTEEILFVKELFSRKQNDVKDADAVVKQTLFVPHMTGDKKQSGISVYADVWERWGEFKASYSMYSGTDLLTLALEEFMEKYNEKDSTPKEKKV